MAISCVIDDYVLGRRSSLLFNDNQCKTVMDQWHKVDPLLLELQHFNTFVGKTSWHLLEPIHFRMLIATTLTARDTKLAKEDLFNDQIPLVQSLYFLLMGLAYCLQCRTGVAVDSMKLMRINDVDISFEFTLSMIADTNKPKKEPKSPSLTVVVDNTIE